MVLKPRPNEPDSKVAKAQSLGHLRLSWLFTESQQRDDVSTTAPVAAPAGEIAGGNSGPVYLYQNRDLSMSGAPPPPPSGVRVRIRLSQVRGVRFVSSRQDPELLVSLLYNAQELRTNPAVSDANDPSVFPVQGTFTITPKASDQIAFRVFDADDLWGRPLGVANVKWEESLAATSRGGPQAQQSVFASPLVDERGEARGEVLYMIAAEDKSTSSGELEYEVRQAQEVSGIPNGAHVVCRTVVGGVEQYSKPVAALTRTIFFGARFKTTSFTGSDVITVELADVQTGAVYAGGTLSIGPDHKDGRMWLNLIQPATKQPVGTLFIEWRFTAVVRRPLSEYVTCPDGALLGVVEVLQVRGFEGADLHRPVSVQIEQNQQAIARSDTVTVAGSIASVGHTFFAPVDVSQAPSSPQRTHNQSGYTSTQQGSNTSTLLRLVDEQTGHSMGDAVVPLGSQNEVESWVSLNSGKQALIRTVVVRGLPVGGPEEKNLVVRVKRVEPGQHLSGQRDCVLSLQVNPESTAYGGSPSMQRTAAFKPQGVQLLDTNFFFPAHLFPRTQKRFPLEVCLLEAAETSMGHGLGACTTNISRLRRGGDLTLDMQDGTRILLSYLWVDLAGAHIGDVPSVKTLTLIEANLRNNVTERYDAIIVQLSTGTGGAVVRSAPSGHPSPQNPRFGDQPFNIVEGTMTMPLRVTLIGVHQGREESIGVADVTSESFSEGRQLVAVRRRADEVASILFETTVTLSAGADGSSPRIRRKGPAKSGGDESYPVKVLFVAGRPFGTRMEPHETLEVLKPYLSRHFAVLEEEQQLTWNNRPLEWNRTVAQNKVRLGDDGVANFVLSSTNKRNLYVNIKTPSGKVVVVSASPQSSVKQVKTQLVERDDTDLDGEPHDGISLLCNRTELADDESLGFYRIQSGNTLFAMMKPRNKASKIRSLPQSNPTGRVTLRVEGPYGDESIVQLGLDEPVAQLRGILSDEDNVRSDIFVNEQRILNEDERLGNLGVCRTSSIKFVLNKFRLGSPERIRAGPSGGKFGAFDVEGVDGIVEKKEVNFDEPVSGLRNAVTNEPSAQLYYNGRLILNENRTFRDMEASQHGGHFQFRFPIHGERGGGVDRDLLVQRQRATESLQLAVIDLQRQLEASKASQNAERQLSVRLMNTERELADMHQRYQNSLTRIQELEDAIDRQQLLLQRVASTTSSNPGFNPHVSLRGSSGALALRPIGGSYVDTSGLGSTFYQSRY
jgi:hypothetical protein